MSTATTSVTVTPAMMAEAFWGMASDEQIEFFKELSARIAEDHKTNPHAYTQGELQWHHVAWSLYEPGNEEARSMLMTMAAPLYLNTLRAAGQAA